MKKVSEELDYFGYEEQKGFYPLREAISKYVKSFGIQASPSSILIVSGALQALQLISIGLLHRESTVLLEQPSYLYSLPCISISKYKSIWYINGSSRYIT